LGQFLLPLECEGASSDCNSKFDCDNPERVDPNLMVTKVNLEIDDRTTMFSGCNLCNGIDPLSKEPCKKGTYICDCFSDDGYGCDSKKFGVLNVTDAFAPRVPSKACESALTTACGSIKYDHHACKSCVYHQKERLNGTCQSRDFDEFCPDCWSPCNATSAEWSCWNENLPRKTAGKWYSTQKAGMCTDTSAPGNCSWKVLSMKTVTEQCLKNSLMSTVESHGSECFQGCGPRNATSSCWIGCFFDTMMGVDARHSASKPLGGMTLAAIEKGWTDAFVPKEQGGYGCDEVDLSASEWAQLVV